MGLGLVLGLGSRTLDWLVQCLDFNPSPAKPEGIRQRSQYHTVWLRVDLVLSTYGFHGDQDLVLCLSGQRDYTFPGRFRHMQAVL